MFRFLSRWWCQFAHDEVYRPVRGYYRCVTCMREWPVLWENHAGLAQQREQNPAEWRWWRKLKKPNHSPEPAC